MNKFLAILIVWAAVIIFIIVIAWLSRREAKKLSGKKYKGINRLKILTE